MSDTKIYVGAPTPVVGGVTCKTQMARLPLEVDALQDVANRGSGGMWYVDVEINAGAKFLAMWHQDDAIFVAYLVEEDETIEKKRFAVVPIHFRFPRPRDVDLHPLGAVAVPVMPGLPGMAVFAVYEVRSVFLNLGAN